jgi:L-aspartate oxidase
MAFRAGASVTDLEFVQFHPTALNLEAQPRFLLSEALRGEGARLVNAAGERFMPRYDPAGDLAPRDRVARGLVYESRRTGKPVFLSLAHLERQFVHERFPLIAETCARAGLDLGTDPIPVGPAAHYMMGGVETDLDGRTTLAGLFAAGEVACTGVHGANRLASNSLLEGLVFGARAGVVMRTGSRGSLGSRGSSGSSSSSGSSGSSGSGSTSFASSPSVEEIQALMWRHVGLFRDRAGLSEALAILEPAWRADDAALRAGEPHDSDAWRRTSILTVGLLIARAALRREESRGGHYRTDFPERDDIHWKRRVSDTRTD